jgi:hypothetical protein
LPGGLLIFLYWNYIIHLRGKCQQCSLQICHLLPHPRLLMALLLSFFTHRSKGNMEVVFVSILSDFLPSKEVFQMQLRAFKMFITQIIFYLPYHLHLTYNTYFIMKTILRLEQVKDQREVLYSFFSCNSIICKISTQSLIFQNLSLSKKS